MRKKQIHWTPLFAGNFLSVFNDNLLKYCIIFVAMSWQLPSKYTHSFIISAISAALILPYLFFSPIGGVLATRYPKKTIFKWGKILEIATLIVSCITIYYQQFIIAGLSVFIMGTISCLYSPAKYGLIRDIGGEEGVSFGSGVFEMMSFLGILLGTMVAAYLSDYGNIWLIILLLLGTAVSGYISTTKIRVNESNSLESTGQSSLNPIKYILHTYAIGKKHTNVNKAVFGASVFWLIGSLLQMNLVIHIHSIYGQSNTATGTVMAIAAIGIALGTFSAGKLSGENVRPGLILIGLTGMIISLLPVLLLPLSINLFTICIFCFSFLGGMFQIPCLAIVQKAPVGHQLGEIIGYLNIITFLFILIGSAIFSVLTSISNENSYLVFWGILSIVISALIYFSTQSDGIVNDCSTILQSIFESKKDK